MDFEDDMNVFEQTVVHLRLHNRRNRKFTTIIEGLPEIFDEKKLLRAWKKNYYCNGNIIYHKDKAEKNEEVERIILSGDQRENVAEFLEYMGIANK